jgi:hypothetical protein
LKEMPRVTYLVCLGLMLGGCGDDRASPEADADTDAEGAPDRVAELRLSGDAPVATIDERILSVAVDTAQVVGGTFWDPDAPVEGTVGGYDVDPYDFTRPRLRRSRPSSP